MRTLEVTDLRISARVREKLREKHDLDADAVREAVEGVGALPFRWVYDQARGHRALVLTAVLDEDTADSDIPCLVVLYPAAGEAATVWNLGSAYPVSDKS